MAKTNIEDLDSDLATQAAEWVEKLSENGGDRYADSVEEWCAQSAEHRRELMLAAITSIQLEALRQQPYSFGVRGYRDSLHRWTVEHIGDHASLERLANEVHARLSERRAELASGRVTALIYSIATDLVSTSTSGSLRGLDPSERALQNAIRDLPPLWRDVLLLCSRDRLTHEEAARELGISAAKVRECLTKGRRAVTLKVFSTGLL